eukprot:2934121-Prymnesium_polylepis.1
MANLWPRQQTETALVLCGRSVWQRLTLRGKGFFCCSYCTRIDGAVGGSEADGNADERGRGCGQLCRWKRIDSGSNPDAGKLGCKGPAWGAHAALHVHPQKRT